MFKTIAAICVILLLSLIFIAIIRKEHRRASKPGTLRYAVIGDSYTIGQGVPEAEIFPITLIQKLHDKNIDIVLVSNPARTGYTTQDALDRELSQFEKAEPDFATLLIGVNDIVKGIDAATFKKNLVLLMDGMQSHLSNPKNLIVLTIPDYTVTPTGANFSDPKENAKKVQAFNKIITEEAEKRGLSVVDIYPISKGMKDNPELVINDGLHPSAKEYELWANAILPTAEKLLKASQPAIIK